MDSDGVSWNRTNAWSGAWMLLLVGALGSARAADSATLRAVIREAQSGEPVACVVALWDAQGKLALEQAACKTGFFCAGKFTRELPAGRVRLRISRGHEYRAVEQELELAPDEQREIGLTLERVVDMRQRGWFAGDSHSHMIHGERTLPVTFEEVALAVRAADLHYFSLAHTWTLDHPTPERLAAELTPRSQPDCVLTWNVEAPKNYYRGDAGRCLGHCWSVNTGGRRPDGANVIELLLAASAADYESDKPTYANFESHRLIHAQGGVVAYSHPLRWWMGPWGGQGGYPAVKAMRVSNMAVELPLDTLLGPTYDGLDVMTSAGELEFNAKAFELWGLLLNHGYRVAPTGSSDSCFDRSGGATPGSARTYTFLEGKFTLAALAKGLAAGQNLVTTGPLMIPLLDGQPPGTARPADGKAHALQIEVWASGADTNGLRQLELLRNGQPHQLCQFAPGTSSFRTNWMVQEAETAWYCVRLTGRDPRQRAVSGAFYFEAADYAPPAPVPARITLRLEDAGDKHLLPGAVTELAYLGPVPRPEQSHALPTGEGVLKIAGTLRLRAEVPGYAPLTLSPVLDNPPLMDLITRLEERDLLDWRTFEQIRKLLGEVRLTFALKKTQ